MNNSKALKFGGAVLLAYLILGNKSEGKMSLEEISKKGLFSDNGLTGINGHRGRAGHNLIFYSMPENIVSELFNRIIKYLDACGLPYTFEEVSGAKWLRTEKCNYTSFSFRSLAVLEYRSEEFKNAFVEAFKSNGQGMYFANWQVTDVQFGINRYGLNPFVTNKSTGTWANRWLSIERTKEEYEEFVDARFCEIEGLNSESNPNINQGWTLTNKKNGTIRITGENLFLNFEMKISGGKGLLKSVSFESVGAYEGDLIGEKLYPNHILINQTRKIVRVQIVVKTSTIKNRLFEAISAGQGFEMDLKLNSICRSYSTSWFFE